MNRNIQSIETLYRGIYFRSRLEARWAVFFDSFGIPYNYENVGMSFGELRYLPDFELPLVGGGVHVEIKPASIPRDEQKRLSEIVAATAESDVRLWVIIGYPAQGEYSVETNTESGPAEFATCRKCGGPALIAEDWYEGIMCGKECVNNERQPLRNTGKLTIAHEYAMTYKFDHKTKWTSATLVAG